MTKPSIFKSRKFWILVADTFISILSAVLGILLTPDKLAFVLGIVASIQPVIYAVINGIAQEDVAAMNNGLTR